MQEESNFFAKLIESGYAYFWFIVLAVWGGTVNYLGRVKQGKVEAFSFAELIGEWVISGFAGLLTAYLCYEMGLSWYITAFSTGIAGHLGARLIFLFEDYFKDKLPFNGKNKDSDKDK